MLNTYDVTYLGCSGSYLRGVRDDTERVKAADPEGACREFNQKRGATYGGNSRERYRVRLVPPEPTEVVVEVGEPPVSEDIMYVPRPAPSEREGHRRYR